MAAIAPPVGARAVVPAPAAPAAPAGSALQVSAAVRALSAGSVGPSSMVLRLDPPGLGTVHLAVHVEGQQLTVRLWADTPAAHQSLQNALPDLRQSLDGWRRSDVQLGAGSGAGTGFSSPDTGSRFAPSRPAGLAGPSGVTSADPVAEPRRLSGGPPGGSRLCDLRL